MSTLARWTLQLMVLCLFAWLATVAGQWSHQRVNGTSSERLAQLHTDQSLVPVRETTRDSVFVKAAAQ